MIRRFNYTDRRKIPRSCVRIRVRREGSRSIFDAELALEKLKLPPDARLFVEAYHRAAYRRFDFGAVVHPRPPAERWLDGIPVQSPMFRVKVVKRSDDGFARILAAVDRIVPQQSESAPDERQSLLPVEYVDLGDRVWALDLESDWPRLLLNCRFPSIRDVARAGREFVALVYPEVFRAILTRALHDERFDPDCDDDDWGTMWLRFACQEMGRPHPPQQFNTEAMEWIDEAVNAFCARTRVATHFQKMASADSD